MGELEFGNVPVSEVMNTDPPVVEKTASLCKVARLLRRHSHVWVVEEKEQGVRTLLGIVTEKDFLELLNPLPDRMYATGMLRAKSLYHGDMSMAQEFMVSPVISVSPKATVADALEIEAGMKQRLWAWMERIDDYILHGPERTPYYDRAMKEYLDTRSK